MGAIIIPILILGGVGLVMGLFLAFASKKFEVEVNPNVEKIMEVLPGINCGACGFPGCSGYAEAIALEGGRDYSVCSWWRKRSRGNRRDHGNDCRYLWRKDCSKSCLSGRQD